MTDSPDTLYLSRVVAYNLARARTLRRMGQEQAGQEIAQYIGKPWSKANWSAAEKSLNAPPERVRRFTILEVVAFCQLFRLPIAFFLFPPPERDAPSLGAPKAEYLHLVADQLAPNDLQPSEHMQDRMLELMNAHPQVYSDLRNLRAEDAEYRQDLRGLNVTQGVDSEGNPVAIIQAAESAATEEESE